ncbi:MAG: hypothetical protein ACTHL8_18200, partial [Burkholderiaceae bacterium]
MRNLLLAAALLAVAGPACAQTSLSTPRFRVTSDDATATLVGDTLQATGLPVAISDGGGNEILGPDDWDFHFAPQPGYAIRGEIVTFTVDMTVEDFAPTVMEAKASGAYEIDIDGLLRHADASEGGTVHDDWRDVVRDPDLSAALSLSAIEGIACPLGDEADGCGDDWVFLRATVAFTSFTITPIVEAVPEP